jgi:hypothetical protein
MHAGHIDACISEFLFVTQLNPKGWDCCTAVAGSAVAWDVMTDRQTGSVRCLK